MEFFTYKAKLIKVIDGDTIKVSLDLGFNIFYNIKFRLANINVPEINTEAGKNAKFTLSNLMPIGSDLEIKSIKYDKYGRSLGIVYFNNININQYLVDKGFATPYMVKN